MRRIKKGSDKKRSTRKVVVMMIPAFIVIYFALIQKTKSGKKDLLTKDDITEAIETGTRYSSGSLDGSILEAIYNRAPNSRHGSYSADSMWIDILDKGSEIMKNSKSEEHLVVFEVGAQAARQSLIAAQAQFHTYCIEPSPISFKKIHSTISAKVKEDPPIGEFLHLYNAAAGAKSGEMLDFRTSGGTGDGVGRFDIWNMKEGEEPEDFPEYKKTKMVQIQSLKLDDIVMYNKAKPDQLSGLESGSNPPKVSKVFAMKIDTQGYEPQVFAGLKQSIRNQKIEYIMTEYWPKGMALYDKRPACEIAVPMLETLIEAGYKLFALPLAVHGSINDKAVRSALSDWKRRPLHDIKADCQYLFDLEKEFVNENYHLGYWTDVLAIAPFAERLEPKAFGK